MADERKIVIVLKTEEGGTNGTDPAKTEPEETPEKSSTAKAVAAFAVKEALTGAVSEVLNWTNYAIDKNNNLNDDYISQRNKTIAMQMISKTGSFASTIFNSAASGAMVGGPWGAVIGAVLGTVQASASVIRENTQAYEQQAIQLDKMDAQLDYTRQRAGWSTQAASIGEDL